MLNFKFKNDVPINIQDHLLSKWIRNENIKEVSFSERTSSNLDISNMGFIYLHDETKVDQTLKYIFKHKEVEYVEKPCVKYIDL